MPDNRKSNNEFRAGRITFTVVSIDPVERRAVLKPVETSSALRFLMKLETLPGHLSYNEGIVELRNNCPCLIQLPSLNQVRIVEGVTYVGYGRFFVERQTSNGQPIRLSCIMVNNEFKRAESELRQQSGNLLGNALNQAGLTQSPEPPPSTQVAVAGQTAMDPHKPVGIIPPVRAVVSPDVAAADAARLQKLKDRWQKGAPFRRQPKATLPLVVKT